MDIKVTEVSLHFIVSNAPKTHVGKSMPYVVNTVSTNIERVIPANNVNIPWWIKDPLPNTFKFVYSSPLQDVECSYSKVKSTMSFQGIKYKHVDHFNEHISSVLNVLGTEPVGAPVTRYKAVAKMDLRVPWNADSLADIITNDPEISQAAAMCERVSTLGSRRLFSVAVDVGNGHISRIAITCREGQVTAMMSKLPDEDASLCAANTLDRLLKMYEDSWGSMKVERSTLKFSAVSGIVALREKLPELFINNYTRECPVLPIMMSSEEAERKMDEQRVILYPRPDACSDKSRYYTAPDGHFVGLKRNRLANKEEFPCLVTCYLQDHMDRRGSETYQYYNSKDSAGADRNTKKRPLPKSISNPKYHRKRALSFLNAVELATGVKVSSFPWCPQVTKQELWDWSDDDIMTSIRQTAAPGSLVYRYFEELIGVSVHVVVIKEGNFEPLVPRHRGQYIWSPPYSLHIVIFETYRMTYGNKSCSYDFLTKGNTTMFDDKDDVISYLTAQKHAESVRPLHISKPVREQIIDRNGKCSAITMEDGSNIVTYTRPIAAPVTPEPTCFIDSHIRKMNTAKQEIGLEPIDLSKRSTNDILYFPNDSSWTHYVSNIKSVVTS